MLREPGFLKLLGNLPGYDAKGASAVMPLHQAYPSLGDVRGWRAPWFTAGRARDAAAAHLDLLDK